ncbi:MAG: hypothetical protein Q8M44_00175 [bacterium]|nr:hypothetical protein [bacterium]
MYSGSTPTPLLGTSPALKDTPSDKRGRKFFFHFQGGAPKEVLLGYPELRGDCLEPESDKK